MLFLPDPELVAVLLVAAGQVKADVLALISAPLDRADCRAGARQGGAADEKNAQLHVLTGLFSAVFAGWERGT